MNVLAFSTCHHHHFHYLHHHHHVLNFCFIFCIEGQSKKSFDNDVRQFELVPPVSLPTAGQVVRFVPDSFVPEKSKMESDIVSTPNMGYLEVVDVGRHTIRYLPLPGRRILSLYARWSQVPVVMAPTSDEGLVTIDAAGQVRMWETGFKNLENSLTEWKKLIGRDSQSKLQVSKLSTLLNENMGI